MPLFFLLMIFPLFFLSISVSNSETIYKIKDNEGNFIFTNVVPENGDFEIISSHTTAYEKYDENNIIIKSGNSRDSDKRDIKIQEQENLNAKFRNKAIEIRNRELNIKSKIRVTKQNIIELKEKIDDLLIEGYFADHDIFELNRQKSILSTLEKELVLLKEEKLNLKKEARKNGVLPGVLRVN
ncbi:MAG: hypothetical protein GTO02_21110 [Candidatus Dadabacteria bacterium]|nr:hypothetical protein [Candidatus Dadabacteria bacterium]NIQ16788.1 hypothetical protein [Candidatus Dadabacteria bacterium]